MRVRFLSRADVVACGALDMQAAMADVEGALRSQHAGETIMPAEAALRWDSGAPAGSGGVSETGAYALPAYLGGPSPVAGIKWTAHRARNGVSSDPRVMGLILLTDPRTGRPLAAMESALIGAVRTAATTGVAIRRLHRTGPRRVTVIGAGLHARIHLRMLAAVLPDAQRVAVANRTLEHAEHLVAEMGQELPWALKAMPLDGAGVAPADIVIACTAAGSPFFEAEWVRPGLLAVSIGPFEFTYEAMKQFDAVVVDGWGEYKHTSLKGLFRMYRDGAFPESDVSASLEDLVVRGCTVPAAASVYVSVFGLSIFDIAVASRIARTALERGIGREMPLFESAAGDRGVGSHAQTEERSSTWRGDVASLHIARAAAGPMVSVPEVRAVAGVGLEGDRYFTKTGTWSGTRTAGQVTLIEIETIQALKRDHGMDLGPGDSRRNIVTRGVPLAHLVGQRFQIGAVELRGLRLVEPCDHLARLTDRRVLSALVHRGGLRAEILSDGVISIGDVITPA